MSFVDWIERHRRTLLFVSFALAIAGIYAGITLPVGLFPVTSFPRVRVNVDVGSMPAKQMLVDVTERMEQVMRAVPGTIDVESTTSRGSAQIFVDFPWGADMNQALLQVDTALARALPDLPQGTSYGAIQMSPNVITPFASYALISDRVPSAELRRLATYQIAPLLDGISGVRQVGVLGGNTPEVQVSINPEKLRAYRLTLADVSKAVAETNTIKAVGRLQDNDLLYLTVANNAFNSVQSVRNVALHTVLIGLTIRHDAGEPDHR